MENLYEKNGLIFWTEQEIIQRNNFEDFIVNLVKNSLLQQNLAFNFFKIEAPLLTPSNLINKNYTSEDVFVIDDLTLRPETTMGSYIYAKHILEAHNKIRMPIVVWQHGKSFRREQDQVTKNMRLKEFYQLEFQIIYGLSTVNDYSIKLQQDLVKGLSLFIGDCRIEESDRLPSYSESTLDIICERTNMEVCSISKRTDFEGAKVLEVAIGTDRLLYNFFVDTIPS